MNLYVIYDTAAEYSSPIFESKNDATAAREFRKVKTNDKDPARDDYELYRLGTYHEHDMKIIPEDPPVRITLAALPVPDDPEQLTFDLQQLRRKEA